MKVEFLIKDEKWAGRVFSKRKFYMGKLRNVPLFRFNKNGVAKFVDEKTALEKLEQLFDSVEIVKEIKRKDIDVVFEKEIVKSMLEKVNFFKLKNFAIEHTNHTHASLVKAKKDKIIKIILGGEIDEQLIKQFVDKEFES